MTSLFELQTSGANAKLEHQIILLELLGGDIDDAVEDRLDAQELWPLLNGSATELLAFLVGVKHADLASYLNELWDAATENLENIEDSLELDIDSELDLDSIDPEAADDLLKDL